MRSLSNALSALNNTLADEVASLLETKKNMKELELNIITQVTELKAFNDVLAAGLGPDNIDNTKMAATKLLTASLQAAQLGRNNLNYVKTVLPEFDFFVEPPACQDCRKSNGGKDKFCGFTLGTGMRGGGGGKGGSGSTGSSGHGNCAIM